VALAVVPLRARVLGPLAPAVDGVVGVVGDEALAWRLAYIERGCRVPKPTQGAGGANQVEPIFVRREDSASNRWVETVQSMAGHGVTLIVECGPGGVLTGLNKRSAEVEAVGLKDAVQLTQLAASTATGGSGGGG